MLKHWNKLLTSDCTVVEINGKVIFPIFKVGSSSLRHDADKTYTNNDISRCGHIYIFIRDPGDRFVSGLNEYCEQNNLDVEASWDLVGKGKLIDKHFAPQYIWLLHLYKFYKGVVTIKPFTSLKRFTAVHKKKNKKKKIYVPLLKNFVEVDYELMEYYNKTVELGDIVRKHKNVLS